MTIQEKLAEQRERVIAEYASGKSTRGLAKEFNCNCATVWYFLKNNQVAIRKHTGCFGQMHQYAAQIISLHKEGRSAYAIGKEIGIGKHTVLRWFKKLGLSTAHKSTQREEPLTNLAGDIVAMYQDGNSTIAIARRLKCAATSVWRSLKNSGVTLRPSAKYQEFLKAAQEPGVLQDR